VSDHRGGYSFPLIYVPAPCFPRLSSWVTASSLSPFAEAVLWRLGFPHLESQENYGASAMSLQAVAAPVIAYAAQGINLPAQRICDFMLP